MEKQIFRLFSVPECVWCDNGSQLVSKIFKDFLERYGVKVVYSNNKNSAQGNISERTNRYIINSIKAYMKEDHRVWDQNIHLTASALRNSIHDATKCPPYYLVFGSHMVMIINYWNCWIMTMRIDRWSLNQILQLLKSLYWKIWKSHMKRIKNL